MKLHVALMSALLLSGCKKANPSAQARPGAPCSRSVCDGTDKALLCVDGVYVATSCKGTGRCTDAPFACDFGGNAPGEPCNAPPEARSRCTADGKERVECVRGVVSRDVCDGPRGCAPRRGGTTMACDTRLEVGRRCAGEGDWCSTAGTEWLSCEDNKLSLASKCRGPAGCATVAGGAVACDVSIAELDDPCSGKATACSSDATRVLRCAEGVMRLDVACPAGKACRHTAGVAACGPRSP